MNTIRVIYTSILLLFATSLWAEALEECDGAHCIKLQNKGEQDKPIATVWISTKKFALTWGIIAKLVTSSEESIEQISEAINDTACQEPLLNHVGPWGTLGIYEYKQGREQKACILKPKDACEFLVLVSSILKTVPAATDTEEVAYLASRLGCPAR